MTRVAVLILHPTPAARAGEFETWVGAARSALAERHRRAFLAAGADLVTIVGGPPDGRSFGGRVREHLAAQRPDGLVVLGSGAIPLATSADRRAFVAAAASPERVGLANNRYSADVVAIGRAADLPPVPDLATDNELPRWLAEAAGWDVADLSGRRRLGVDVDGPLDLALLGPPPWATSPPDGTLDDVMARIASVRAVASDPRSELLVVGRMSAAGLAWLERGTASRTRALVEERGFRTRRTGQRPVRSTLGLILDHEGPDRIGAVLATLGDAALIDSRVLLAHRLGPDEADWPSPEDRFASDLLLPDRIADPWLAALTRAARDAAIPIVLGGHTLVGPGLGLALSERPRWT